MSRGATVLQGDRAKAYRPLPAADRRRALEAGLEAYGRGDFFLAHEILEPAWMGTDDPVERDLHQGLIKVAAAYVHAARGNPLGVDKNLRGARSRLAAARDAAGGDAATADIDLDDLVAAIDARLARPLDPSAAPRLDPPPVRRRRQE